MNSSCEERRVSKGRNREGARSSSWEHDERAKETTKVTEAIPQEVGSLRDEVQGLSIGTEDLRTHQRHEGQEVQVCRENQRLPEKSDGKEMELQLQDVKKIPGYTCQDVLLLV